MPDVPLDNGDAVLGRKRAPELVGDHLAPDTRAENKDAHHSSRDALEMP
jgi:hypothetical protein